jgi:FMN phosphatase YigB (HAD superfamily)
MSQNGVLMTGALEFLQKIIDNVPDTRIYIITNGVTRNAMGRIASTGLKNYISNVFVSDSIGVSILVRHLSLHISTFVHQK